MNHVMRSVGGFCLLLIGGLTCSASAQMRPADSAAAPGIIPTGFGESVDRDVVRVRAATARFRIAADAIAEGYPRHTECVDNPPQGAMGFHFQNHALLDATLEVERPEVLVYERMPDGTFKLNGVEYLVPISAWTRDEPPTIMGAETEAGGETGDLVPPRVDLGAEPVRHLCGLESTSEVLRILGAASAVTFIDDGTNALKSPQGPLPLAPKAGDRCIPTCPHP